MGSCGRCLLYTVYVILIVMGLFFTACGIFFFSTAFNTKGNCVPNPKSIVEYAHRSDTQAAQENTTEAVVSAVNKGYGVEIDIYIISTGELIVFHDDNAKDLTGVDLDIDTATLEKIQSLTYLNTIRNTSYPTKPKIPLFKDVIKAACDINPKVNIDFDIKFDLTTENMKKLMDIIDASPCECASDQLFIFATPYFYNMSPIKESFNNRRCNKLNKVALWFHPDTYPLGEYFWLKTRFAINIGKPDIINAYYKIWQTHPDLLEGFNNDGYCTAVYGQKKDVLDKIGVNQYIVKDVSDASVTGETYTDNNSAYIAVGVMLGIGLAILIAGIVMLVLTCCGCMCKRGDKVSP